MPQLQDTDDSKSTRSSLSEALETGELAQVQQLLNRSLRSAEVAEVIESTPPKMRMLLWNLLNKEQQSAVLQYLDEDLAGDIVADMDTQSVVDFTAALDADDAADLLQQLPEQVTREVLLLMDHSHRQRVEAVLSYPEDTAGGLMDLDTITIRPDITLDVVLRYLRMLAKIPKMTDTLYVVNRKDKFLGTLPINKLLVGDPTTTVREIMETETQTVAADLSDTEVALLFERHDLVSVPVLDPDNHVLGRITIDDVVDVIRDDADHTLLGMAGLDEDEDTFATVGKSLRRRTIWLFINLLTALLASAVIGLYTATIEKVVALAILMPIVASMGGIAGSQALTLIIRGMALGHVEGSNATWLLRRESLIGLFNGLLWALVVAAVASWWFNDYIIGLIIALAMLINLAVAALAGASLPLILRNLDIDPAVAGGVLLTTITDVVGFMAFLGLATAFYA